MLRFASALVSLIAFSCGSDGKAEQGPIDWKEVVQGDASKAEFTRGAELPISYVLPNDPKTAAEASNASKKRWYVTSAVT